MKINEAVEEAQRSATKLVESNEVRGDTWTISLPKTRIHTLDQLAEHCKIDLKIWEVERFVCNKWEVGMKPVAYTDMFTVKTPKADKGFVTNRIPMWQRDDTEPKVIPLFQVKAFLRKNRAAIAARDLAAEFIEKVRKYAPTKFSAPPKPSAIDRDVMLELSPVDHHFGALIWGKETGGDDYDMNAAQVCWRDSAISLLERTAPYRAGTIALVLGHDQQNADNREGSTEAGTPQNMDSRYQKVASASQDSSVWLVDRCLSIAERVIVIIVPGNHDRLSAWHLGRYLEAWFHNCKRVEINNSPNPKKYLEFGVNMLLFTHGDKGKLEHYDKTMAAEEPEMWGRTKWREAHTGDKHHRRMIELQGATVRILPSLRPPDAWTSENHYVGALRAAEAYAWHKREGLMGTAVYSILRKKR